MREEQELVTAQRDVRRLMTKIKAFGAAQIPIGSGPDTVFIPGEMAFELFAHLETMLQRRLDVLRGPRAS